MAVIQGQLQEKPTSGKDQQVSRHEKAVCKKKEKESTELSSMNPKGSVLLIAQSCRDSVTD